MVAASILVERECDLHELNDIASAIENRALLISLAAYKLFALNGTDSKKLTEYEIYINKLKQEHSSKLILLNNKISKQQDEIKELKKKTIEVKKPLKLTRPTSDYILTPIPNKKVLDLLKFQASPMNERSLGVRHLSRTKHKLEGLRLLRHGEKKDVFEDAVDSHEENKKEVESGVKNGVSSSERAETAGKKLKLVFNNLDDDSLGEMLPKDIGMSPSSVKKKMNGSSIRKLSIDNGDDGDNFFPEPKSTSTFKLSRTSPMKTPNKSTFIANFDKSSSSDSDTFTPTKKISPLPKKKKLKLTRKIALKSPSFMKSDLDDLAYYEESEESQKKSLRKTSRKRSAA